MTLRHSLLAVLVLATNYLFGQGKQQLLTFEGLNNFLKENANEEVIYIKNGVYNNVTVTLTRLQGVTIIAETPGGVVLTGKTSINIRNSSNICFSGFHFKSTWSQYLLKLENVSNSIIENNFFDHCEGNAYSRVIGLQGGSNYNKIINNTFEGIHTMGITISEDDNFYNTISKNVFLNIPRVKKVHPESKDGNGMETISIGTVAIWNEEIAKKNFHTVVSYNYFENIEGDMNEVICVKANSNLIEHNYFTNNAGGISLRYGENNIVKNNIFIENQQNIRVFGKGHSLLNNIIYKDKIGIQLPASNLENKAENLRIRRAGYFQAQDISILDNIIFTEDGNPFSIGSNSSELRNLRPTGLKIERNKLRETAPNTFNLKNLGLRRARVRNNINIDNDWALENAVSRKKYFFGKTW